MKTCKSKPALRSSRGDRARAIRRPPSHRSPTLTINTSLPVFLFVGVLFTSVGFVVLYVFRNSEEVVIDYTHCTSVTNSSQLCSDVVGASKCWCEVPFRIDNEMKEPVFLYYGLISIFKVAKRLASSEDGDASNSSTRSAGQVVPADVAAANRSGKSADSYSMSTDTLTVFSVEQSMYVRLNRTGVAWPDMKCGRCSRHFPAHVPKGDANLSEARAKMADVGARSLENEDFMVWMQPIASSTFGKLYRHSNYSGRFNGSLPKGDYLLLVAYTHPITVYGGGKSLIVANSTVLGAKNRLLGVAFVGTGSVCLVASIFVCAVRLRRKVVRKKKV